MKDVIIVVVLWTIGIVLILMDNIILASVALFMFLVSKHSFMKVVRKYPCIIRFLRE